ncbi:hypothetical protein DBV10_18715 [Acidovorax sp. FJL06]|nr:hypothetical protein DBV10_18715 [Acidovorax sp. FJL06]
MCGFGGAAGPSGIDLRAAVANTLFGQVGAEALDWVTRRAVIERYKSPSVLSPAGQLPRHVRLVLRGSVDLVSRSAAGKEVVVSSLGPGHWAGWMQVFTPQPPRFDTCCSANSQLAALGVGDLRTCCEQFPQLYPLIIGEVGARMQLLTEWAGQSVLVAPEHRMAKLIGLLAREQGLVSGRAVLVVTQARLAGLACCSRQSANLLVGALERKGLVRMAYGRCEIADLQRLAEFADL